MRAEQWRKGRRHLLPGKVISYTNYHRGDQDEDGVDIDDDDGVDKDEDGAQTSRHIYVLFEL